MRWPCCGRPPRPPTGSWPRWRTARSSDGPRRTWPARSGSGSWRRATNAAEFSIVASGPNSASPHHEPGERVIAGGEPIVIDIGGTLGGYGSDITRTIWVTGPEGGGPDAEFLRLYGVLHDAQAAATAAVRPGVPCEEIDGVARRRITDAGYGPRFFHRTGHGIGLEGHEEPYLVAGSLEPLAPGMAFSVEPGIYLEGRYGARIEDIVVCGETGPLVLNQVTRDLHGRHRLNRAQPSLDRGRHPAAGGIIRRSAATPGRRQSH